MARLKQSVELFCVWRKKLKLINFKHVQYSIHFTIVLFNSRFCDREFHTVLFFSSFYSCPLVTSHDWRGQNGNNNFVGKWFLDYPDFCNLYFKYSRLYWFWCNIILIIFACNFGFLSYFKSFCSFFKFLIKSFWFKCF